MYPMTISVLVLGRKAVVSTFSKTFPFDVGSSGFLNQKKDESL